ncbi:MAG: succinate dehydrogenase, cytochrome b556 subunit [Chloroflexi bacterium]|nr:succinate dehydrogenase, cytochrome b556 subunit [Chloroflexota bacterium]
MILHPGPRHSQYDGGRAGWWAWLLQRVSGVALVGYLFLHIGVISTSLGGARTFDPVLRALQTPPFVILDLGLLATVLYHALNGFRILLIEMGVGARQQAALFWGCIAVTAVALAVATYFSIPLIIRGWE